MKRASFNHFFMPRNATSDIRRKRSRYWRFTSFNYEEEEVEHNINLAIEEKLIDVFEVQTERCPSTGSLHLQGFIKFNSAKRGSFVQNLIGDRTAHLDLSNQNEAEYHRNYCRKPETRISGGFAMSHGDIVSRQGQRNDLSRYCSQIDDGQSISTICLSNPNALRCIKYLKAYESMLFKQRQRSGQFPPLQVLVFWGPTGTGKTRRAFFEYPDIYTLPAANVKHGAIWFDGYDGEETILIDDFEGSNTMPRELFLRLTDRYPMQVAQKGSFIQKRWKRVIITSNYDPKTWYHSYDAQTGTTECDPAVIRRLTTVTHFASQWLPPTSASSVAPHEAAHTPAPPRECPVHVPSTPVQIDLTLPSDSDDEILDSLEF